MPPARFARNRNFCVYVNKMGRQRPERAEGGLEGPPRAFALALLPRQSARFGAARVVREALAIPPPVCLREPCIAEQFIDFS
jgi:hypothetical protein